MNNVAEYAFAPFKVYEVSFRGVEVPAPRSGHRIVCDQNKIYCFGGYNPALPETSRNSPDWTQDQPLFKEMWSFNISTRRWKLHRAIENMPSELASNAMVLYGGKYIMIFGGTGAPFGHKCSNDLYVWCTDPPDEKVFKAEALGVKPPGAYGQAITCYKGHMYTIGGTNGFAYNSDIFRLDLRTYTWDQVFIATGHEYEPLGRYRHEVVRVNDKLHVLGGGTGDWAFELMDIPVFDLETSKWSHLTAKADNSTADTVAPLARKCHSAVQIDSPDGAEVFVVGGTDGVAVFDDIWKLNMQTLQWTLIRNATLPHGLYFHSSAVSPQGCMYVFGGICPRDPSSSRTNTLFKVWVTIPKLNEMCWEALLHYYPHLEKVDHSHLRSLGIPFHFLDRLCQ